eukprot:15037264-Alexandrium_andersonii.AAC.1
MVWGVVPTGLRDLDRYRHARMEVHESACVPFHCDHFAGAGMLPRMGLRDHVLKSPCQGLVWCYTASSLRWPGPWLFPVVLSGALWRSRGGICRRRCLSIGELVHCLLYTSPSPRD